MAAVCNLKVILEVMQSCILVRNLHSLAPSLATIMGCFDYAPVHRVHIGDHDLMSGGKQWWSLQFELSMLQLHKVC